MSLLAFHNKPELKQQLLNQLQAHYDADEIIKGNYWEGGKGCAIGCSLHSSDHSLGEELYGIPTVLWRLEDGIFEALPNKESKEFPIQFIEAISEGANLSKVFYKLSIRMLKRVRPLASDDGKKAIDQVIKLFEKPEGITADTAAAADYYASKAAAHANAADAAAAHAAASASDAADAAHAHTAAAADYYASKAADNAANAAADAADAHADAADDPDANAALITERIKQRDDLLELLREAK